MVKTRGLKEAKEKLGDLEEIISSISKKKKKIKIFEAGCGYGKVMMGLSKRFGNKIDIIGMNLKKMHGDRKKMISFALDEKIISKKDIRTMKIPKIIFGDAGKKLPFKTGTIDLVYSQTASYLFKDKMNFFKEVGRILSKDGIALITPSKSKLPKKLLPLLRIYKNKKLIPFKRYIEDFKGIRIIKSPKGREVVEIKKSKLDFNLKLKTTLNTNKLNKKWFGVQSTYVIRCP